MKAFILDDEAQNGNVRFGELAVTPKDRYAMPATAPILRTMAECAALNHLAFAGHQVPAVVVPATKRKLVTGSIDSLLTGSSRALDDYVKPLSRPLVLTDPESEALSFNCQARQAMSEQVIPESVREGLLKAGLQGNSEKGIVESGQAWETYDREYKLATITKWTAQVQEEAGSPIYFGIGPIVRANRRSALRAWGTAWEMTDGTQTMPFKGRGIHLLTHAEVFLETNGAREARDALFNEFLALEAAAAPVRSPYVSIKVHDPGDYLIKGPQAAVARRNLSEFLQHAAHSLRALDGVLIPQNLGTWALGGLMSGGDIASFRADARNLWIDPIWGAPKKSKGKKKTRVRRASPMPRHDVPALNPWDPDRLADGRLRDFQQLFETTNGFPTAHHVAPEPYWKRDSSYQHEYRARQVIGSFLDLGQQLREAGRKLERLDDSIRSRISRMREQDAMMDLCPLT